MEKIKDRNTNTYYKYWVLRGLLIFIILLLERAISKTNLHTQTCLSLYNFSINSSLTRVESRFSQISVTLRNFMLNLNLILNDLKYHFSANSFSHDLWISTCWILEVGAKLPGSHLKPVFFLFSSLLVHPWWNWSLPHHAEIAQIEFSV